MSNNIFEVALTLHCGLHGVDKDLPIAKILYEKAVERGHTFAMYHLAQLLFTGGEGVDQDKLRAKEHYEQVIEKGDIRLINNCINVLALLLWEGGNGIKKDAVRAKTLFEQAIKRGHVSALFNLGVLLREGAEGVDRDLLRSNALFQEAIAMGHIDSMVQLGFLYETGGGGIDKDPVQAKKLYEQAIEKGHNLAHHRLAIMLCMGAEGVEKDGLRAKKLYEHAIENGDVEAINGLAILFHKGSNPIEKDAPRAKSLYEQAIEKGSVSALHGLGTLLHRGADGVEKDAVRAKGLFEEAIGKGNVPSLNALAVLLDEGLGGVERDVVRAKELYERAIENGSVNAIYDLATLLHEGQSPLKQDASRAKILYEQAIQRGNVSALYGLAQLLREGVGGIEKDAVRAKNLYEEGIAKGDIPSLNGLAILYHNGGDGVQRDEVRAQNLYQEAIDKGIINTINGLACFFREGVSPLEMNAPRAKMLYEKAIQKGNVNALNGLASLLHSGADGVFRAEALYKEAIAKGNLQSLHGLAVLYRIGEGGVKRDGIRSQELHQRAIDEGVVVAYYWMAILLEKGSVGLNKNPSRAVQFYERAIENGNVHAICDLAMLLEYGDDGVEQDAFRAKELYQQAIDMGSMRATHKLAALLHEGVGGIERDHVLAKTLWEQAVDKGFTHAVSCLGVLLCDGADGIEQDAIRGKFVLEEGAKKGDISASIWLASVLSTGCGELEQDIAEARTLFEEGIGKGEEHAKTLAMVFYGFLLMYGYEHGRDSCRAKALFEKVIQMDRVNEADMLGAVLGLGLIFQYGGEGIEKDISHAKKLYDYAIKYRRRRPICYRLAPTFKYIFEALGEKAIPIPKELFRWTHRPASSIAKLLLAILLLEDSNGDHDDIRYSKSLLQYCIGQEQDQTVMTFMKSIEECFEERRDSKFAIQNAYAKELAIGNILTREKLMNLLNTNEIKSMDDVICGHKLVCLAKSLGVSTEMDKDSSSDLGRAIQTRLYNAAAGLVDADIQLREYIFHVARTRELIESGGLLSVSSELKSDTAVVYKQINNAFRSISKRLKEVQARYDRDMCSLKKNVMRITQFVRDLANDLNMLHDMLKEENKVYKHAAVAFCMFSLILVTGNSIEDSFKKGTDFFIACGLEASPSGMSTTSHCTVSEQYALDLCNFRTALFMFSEKGAMKNMDEKSMRAILDGVEQSGFRNLNTLQQLLIEQCRQTKSQDVDIDLDGDKSNCKNKMVSSAGQHHESTNSEQLENVSIGTTESRKEGTQTESIQTTTETEHSDNDELKPTGDDQRVPLSAVLNMFTEFNESLLRNGNKVPTTIAKYIFDGFLRDLEKNGIINESQIEHLNLARIISDNVQDHSSSIKMQDLETITSAILRIIL